MKISWINKLLGIKLPLSDKDLIKYFKNYAKKYWFNEYKIEKDFLLTVLLMDFSKSYPELNFKWWTCLNKIYYNYYRLSEDLDFYIISDAWQEARWSIFEKLKNAFQSEKYKDIWLNYIDSEYWTTHNKKRQWWFMFSYKSVFDWSEQLIQIDIRIEHPLLYNPISKKIGSIFYDEIIEEPLFEDTFINVMELKEIAAEKIRAALTRTPKPAIRDFYDIWFMKNHWVDFYSLKNDIHHKIVDYRDNWKPEILYNDLSIDYLIKSIDNELNPVLNNSNIDFWEDDLKQVIKMIKEFKV